MSALRGTITDDCMLQLLSLGDIIETSTSSRVMRIWIKQFGHGNYFWSAAYK
jgi:hypothetical protein